LSIRDSTKSSATSIRVDTRPRTRETIRLNAPHPRRATRFVGRGAERASAGSNRGAETKSRRDIYAARTHDFTLCTFYDTAQISKVASFRFAACKKRTIHARAKCEAGASSRSRIPSRYFRLMHLCDSVNSVCRGNGRFLKLRYRQSSICRCLFRAIRHFPCEFYVQKCPRYLIVDFKCAARNVVLFIVHFYQNVSRTICLFNKIHRKRGERGKRDEEMIGSVEHSNKWRITFSCGGVARVRMKFASMRFLIFMKFSAYLAYQ